MGSQLQIPDECVLAWCAGLIDGEGCLSASFNGGKPVIYLRVVMTDERPVRQLQVHLGGTVRRYVKPPPRSPVFSWYCRQSALPHVLRSLLPYLIVKKHEAEAVLEYLSLLLITPADIEQLEISLRATKSKPGNRRPHRGEELVEG